MRALLARQIGLSPRLAGALVVATVALGSATSASAATISPSTFADEFGGGSACSLREAVQAANTDAAFGGCAAGAGPDTISLRSGTYRLALSPVGDPDDNASGDLDLFADTGTDFVNDSGGPVTIRSEVQDRILEMLSDTTSARIDSVTLSGGSSTDSGGAIRSRGLLEVTDSAFVGNRAAGNGGAVAVRGTGGGPTFVNVTFSGNSAAVDGGAIDVDGPVQVTLVHSTLTSNTADSDNDGTGQGGGIRVYSGGVLLRSTLLAGNADRGGETPDCGGNIMSDGYNLVGTNANCNYFAGSFDKVNVAPVLLPLADNGGLSPTHALLDASPALDSAGPGGPVADQRGAPRSAPDIGAYERVLCGGVVVNHIGGPGDDLLRGTSGPDGMLGLFGRDRMAGLGGADALCGGSGRDRLKGGAGSDRLLGQGGADLLVGGGSPDRCKGGPGRDRLRRC